MAHVYPQTNVRTIQNSCMLVCMYSYVMFTDYLQKANVYLFTMLDFPFFTYAPQSECTNKKE